jgi:fructose-1,6-bisphosphatase/inositol monophosphatase family enzyme
MEDAQALEVALRAARTGGQVALARLGKPDYMRWKAHRDVVSGSTLEVQDVILDVLSRETPDFGVLAEEGPEDEPVPLDAEYLWIVDPICGSLNYVQGIPYFGVSIALRTHGAIRAGAVYDPCRDEMFAAAALILTRAGGTLTDEYGNSWLHSPGGYIASNSVIHGWTMRCLQRVLERDLLPRGLTPTQSPARGQQPPS